MPVGIHGALERVLLRRGARKMRYLSAESGGEINSNNSTSDGEDFCMIFHESASIFTESQNSTGAKHTLEEILEL